MIHKTHDRVESTGGVCIDVFAMPVHPRELITTARKPVAEYDPYMAQREKP